MAQHISIRIAVLLAFLVSFSACTRKGGFDDPNLQILHYAQKDDAKTLDPANSYDSISAEIVPLIYESLYQYDYLSDPYRPIPLLAADLPKVSKDQLTYRIPVRKGVRFADDPCFKATGGKGREVTAHDFVFSMKRLALPSIESQGWWLLEKKFVGVDDFKASLAAAPTRPEMFKRLAAGTIPGIRAIDDYTIELKLTKPYPQILWVLAMSFTAAVPHEAVTAYGDERGNYLEHMVGSGPFILKTWDRGHQLVLDRNPNYHLDFYPTDGAADFRRRGLLADAGKPLPPIDRIHIRVIKEEQPRWLSFLNGDIDSIILPKDNFDTVIENRVNLRPEYVAKGIRLNIEMGAAFYYVSINMKDPVLGKNKALRQAISSAIDREKWIETFTNGRGRKMVHALPPGLADRPPSSDALKIKYDFNLKRTEELLAKAGFPKGAGLPKFKFDMRGADSMNRQLGEFMQSQFTRVGIPVEVIYNTFPGYLEKMKQGDLQLSIGGWSLDYPDAENVYQLLYGPNVSPGPNEANYKNPEFDRLYEKLAVMPSGPARAAVVEKLEAIVQEDAPWAMGYYHVDYVLVRPWLLNHRASDLVQNKIKYWRIAKDIKARYLGDKR